MCIRIYTDARRFSIIKSPSVGFIKIWQLNLRLIWVGITEVWESSWGWHSLRRNVLHFCKLWCAWNHISCFYYPKYLACRVSLLINCSVCERMKVTYVKGLVPWKVGILIENRYMTFRMRNIARIADLYGSWSFESLRVSFGIGIVPTTPFFSILNLFTESTAASSDDWLCDVPSSEEYLWWITFSSPLVGFFSMLFYRWYQAYKNALKLIPHEAPKALEFARWDSPSFSRRLPCGSRFVCLLLACCSLLHWIIKFIVFFYTAVQQ